MYFILFIKYCNNFLIMFNSSLHYDMYLNSFINIDLIYNVFAIVIYDYKLILCYNLKYLYFLLTTNSICMIY